ncbi:MAG: universal stress protein [Legionellales bacterium RIFCSPHIGHO2_12_FULL_42_9]|nr:MAG: universal stress protein [Legionellales bacterium RIFCSPHIGHO2_12_FULL_42_9]
MNYKNIMLALDGSEASHLALGEVIKVTKNQKANLRLIHVLDASLIYQGGPGFDYLTVINACRQEGQAIFDQAKKIISKQSSLHIDQHLIELLPFQGRIAEAIVEEAKEWPADLLVLGTHGRRGFSRFFLGSVAENVVRIATVPVLLVRGPAD